jgi:lipoate-protein ligase B
VAEYPGVWVGEKKVCSIGVHVSHHITTHGFALNVSNDLRYFEYVRPCGLPGEVMTSVSELLGHRVEMKTVIEKSLSSFSDTFCLSCEQENDRWLSMLDAPNG